METITQKPSTIPQIPKSPILLQDFTSPLPQEKTLKQSANSSWQWFEFLCEDPVKTMERDKILFQEIKNSRSLPILRFYRWDKPCLSYGRTAKLDMETELECGAKNLKIVRRPTGGGKVLHQDDLCFSLIWKKEDQAMPWKINDSYCAIHEWIQKTIIQLGIESKLSDRKYIIEGTKDHLPQETIPFKNDHSLFTNIQTNWCFKNPVRFDLISKEKKLVGGAQWRDKNTALHQGSIQIQFEQDPLDLFQKSFENFFKVKLNVYSTAD